MEFLSGIQKLLFLTGLLSLAASVYANFTSREKLSVVFLLFFAFLINSLMASLDPFLNIWDERFHALVAKNLMKHPLMPTLYDNPVVDMAYNTWDSYHVWLHKQPLFLWQIALSFRIFGISEFSLRIPNIVLGTVLVYAAYRSGKLVVNPRVGYLSGLLISSCYFILNLLSGRQAVDHADFSFMVYVSLSVWALIEYVYSGKRYWIFLIGIFAGCAVLCKWLIGLLVYFVWFLYNLLSGESRKIITKDMLVSGLVTLCIALPWQILIFTWYPVEAALTYNYNMRHFNETLDGQGGEPLFHLLNFDLLYGALTSFFILLGIYLMIRNSNNRKMAWSLFGMILLIYILFYNVATQMPAYTIIVALPVFISLAAFLDMMGNFILRQDGDLFFKRLVFLTVIIIFIVFRFDFKALNDHHLSWKNPDSYSSMLVYNKKIFKELELPSNAVIFNVHGHHYIEAMFYTGLPAYSFIPTQQQYEDLKSKNYRVALFKPEKGDLPEYILNDKEAIVIDKSLRGYYD